MPKLYEKLDLSGKRKVFAVGDIHGCFRMLDAKLLEVGFDKTTDMLISVGDLVDRGPQSDEAAYYAQEPWFKHILGNHELMTLDHLNGDSYLHTINGGGWLTKFSDEEKQGHVEALINAPYLLEIITPGGLNVGFVHADLVWTQWEENIKDPDLHVFCWSRTGVKNLRIKAYDPTITGIDKVFFGHNALNEAYTRGNCNWIDTGAGFADGKLTVVDVDVF